MKTALKRLYFFSDVDGTLIHKPAGHLHPSFKNENVIQNFVGAGHAFIMATGRGIRDIRTIAQKLNIPVEYAIAYNGAIIYKNQEEVFANTLSSGQVLDILGKVQTLAVRFDTALLFTDDGQVFSKNPRLMVMLRGIASAVKHKRSYRMWNDKLIEKLVQRGLRFPKVCFIINNRKAITELEEQLKLAFGNQLSIYCSAPNCLEICDANVDKAAAISYIIRREGLDDSQVAFIGDSGNDVCVFLEQEQSYIMNHAGKQIPRGFAQEVEDVADAILDFVMNQKQDSGGQDVAEIDE